MEATWIPILNLKVEIEELWDEIAAAIHHVLRSGTFIMGQQVHAFEREAAEYLGVKHAVSVNSGTDALVIGLKAAGVGPGDEVITTAFTFFATAEAISQVNARPVFVDIDPVTLNLDPALIEQAITPRTKAILPVHVFGLAAEMKSIMEISEKYGLKVIEDTAQAFGGGYRGAKLGTLGDIGCYSFFPSKNLGAYGDGGLIATNNDGIAEVAQMLRVHGSRQKYYNELIGYNSRLDELQAAILRVKLPHLDHWNELRRQVAAKYDELLKELEDVTIPAKAPYSEHVYHQYTIRIGSNKRNDVHTKLKELGIGTMIYYPTPVHRLPVYAHLGFQLPYTEQAAREVLSIPIWPKLEHHTQKIIAESLQKAILS